MQHDPNKSHHDKTVSRKRMKAHNGESVVGHTNALKKVAKWLLELPRPAKQAILLTVDYAVSILCLFLALSLRQGVFDVNASPLLVSLYGLVPIVGLYFISCGTRSQPTTSPYTTCLPLVLERGVHTDPA